MHLVVGLGNPGREHENQRHNVGFVVLDAIRRAEGWPEYKQKFSGGWTRGRLGAQEVALLEPHTFMNLSGESVQAAAAFLKVPPEGIILVHDDLDLPWQSVRLKAGGGHAGHNGIRSVIQRLGSPDFVRVRVGIGRPPPGFRGEVSDWVLSNFDPRESAEVPLVVEAATSAIRRAVDGILSPMRSQ